MGTSGLIFSFGVEMRKAVIVVAFGVFAACSLPNEANSEEPGWEPYIIATGDYGRQIRATPIEMRPYRPLHFYGNTVRRRYHRGSALPVPKGFSVRCAVRGRLKRR